MCIYLGHVSSLQHIILSKTIHSSIRTYHVHRIALISNLLHIYSRFYRLCCPFHRFYCSKTIHYIFYHQQMYIFLGQTLLRTRFILHNGLHWRNFLSHSHEAYFSTISLRNYSRNLDFKRFPRPLHLNY